MSLIRGFCAWENTQGRSLAWRGKELLSDVAMIDSVFAAQLAALSEADSELTIASPFAFG